MKSYLLIFIFLVHIPILSQNIKINPVIPNTNPDLIHFEAEDAIVTNFTTTPTLNYSASGQRTIQLNTYNSNYEGNPYFVEFEVYAQEAGEYSFWYSGTPPGTREELYPSYSSPFTLNVDDKSVKLYREDVDVVEKYAPGFYWISTNSSFFLEKGFHHIKIEVSDKRGFDGKFYLFLDSFFLFKGDTLAPGEIPEIFPRDLNDRSIDNPFNTISYYQNRIKLNPEEIGNYLSLANIYIIIGDYFSSIKMLSRILQLEPKHKEANLLMAKARIWNGDVDVGLKAYDKFLNIYPDNLSVWGEAGKIAAWVSKYDLSLSFYQRGISNFPNDISLKVNLGFTYLWKGDIEEGLATLSEVENSLKSVDSVINTLDSYYINGYPDYAIRLNRESIKRYPESLELYLYLERLYYREGLIEESKAVNKSITDSFIETDELLKILEINNNNKKLKELYINNLESIVTLSPQDLDTRELLVQTYFWNGLTDKSILEYKKILTIRHIQEIENLLEDTTPLLGLKSRLVMINREIDGIKSLKESITKDYYNQIISYRTAKINSVEDELVVAENNLQNSILSLERVILLEELLNREYRSLVEEINRADIDNKESLDFFNNINSDKTWKYDKKLISDDLDELTVIGFKEAAYLGAVLNIYDNSINKSIEYLDYLNIDNLSNKRVSYIARLWAGETNNDLLRELEIYYPSFSQERTFIDSLEEVNPETRIINDEVINNYRDILFKLDNTYLSLGDLQKEVNKSTNLLNIIIEDYLTRSVFNFQEYTYQLRYTIGNYYLETERYDKALREYEHVITIDPLNISANFKLGRVRQLTGNWSSAMESYNKVFQIDPSFESAATMYNTLSRSHPESTTLNISYLSDSNLMHYKENLTTLFNISSNLSLSPSWTNNTINYYTWSDYGSPIDFRVDDLGLKGSLTFLNEQLKITPTLGASIYNSKFSYISPIAEDNFSDTIAGIDYHPILSIGGSYTLNEYSLTTSLGYRQVVESVPDERIDIYSTSWDLSLSGYYNLSSDILNSFSFRSYFKLDNKADANRDNIVGTLLQDLVLGLIINRSQWTILNIYSTTSFEYSSETDLDEYYTPNNVFVSKLGGLIATWFNINEGVAGLSFRAGGGIYIDKLGEESSPSFATDGELEFNYTLRDKTMFMKLFGSGSFSDSNTPDYWSIQSTIGLKIDSYKLLAL